MLVTRGGINKAHSALGKECWPHGKSERFKQKPDNAGSTYAFPGLHSSKAV